jgi:hypothetical protein
MRGFKNDDEKYLAWVAGHPNGFIVNFDVAQTVPNYPMVHSAAHKLLTSSKIGGFTTGDYEKVCSEDLAELEEWSKENHGKRLTFCQSPACGKALKAAALSDEEMEELWS